MFSEIFYSFLITSLIGCSLGIMRMLYKSKCENVKCWGIEIKRNVALEEKADELEMQIKNNKISKTESKDEIII